MRRNALFALALGAVCATPLQGQDGEALLDNCEAITAQQVLVGNLNAIGQANKDDIVRPVVDEVQFLCSTVATTLSNVQPAIGIGFSGANPTLGMGGTLGTRFGLMPRIAVTARVNAALTELPDVIGGDIPTLDNPSDSLTAFETTRMPVGALQADVALGVFNGITLVPMLGGLGSIDLLGSVAFIPVIEDLGLEEAIVSWGAGARVGIMKGGLLAPGISVSGMYRRMGDVQFGEIEDQDPGEFATNLSTLSLRAAVSKGIAMFDFVVGAGYDKYSSDTDFNFLLEYECDTAECTAGKENPTQPFTLSMEDGALGGEVETAAWNVFGNVGLSLLLFNLVAEVGYQQATDVLTSEDLDRDITEEEIGDGRLFGSLGLRLTL